MKIEGVFTLFIDIYHKYLLCANEKWSEEQVTYSEGDGLAGDVLSGFYGLSGTTLTPPFGGDMARDEPKVNIRLPQELKDQLHELAAKNKRSVNAEVVAAIESVIYTARSIEGITDEQHSTIDRIIAAESRNDTKGADKNYKLLKKSKRS